MISVADLVEDLIDRPKTILFLDTCEFLDVIRRFGEHDPREANNDNARSFGAILGALRAGSAQVQVVVSYLVWHEWNQNLAVARATVIEHLQDTGRRIDLIAEACLLGKIAAPSLTERLDRLDLADRLVALAENLLQQALVIGRDDECVERALGRVMDRRRPSHKMEIKDSIHW